MRVKYVVYGKTARQTDGTLERIEVSIEVGPQEFEEEAIHRAKAFVRKHLDDRETVLKAPLGQIASKGSKHELS